MKKPRVICIANRKGGVAKTTTAVELAKHADDLGYKVLVIDMDPQGNATARLTGMKSLPDDQPTTFDLLVDPTVTPEELILMASEDWPNTHVIPANINLSTTQAHLNGKVGYEKLLRKFIQGISSHYDLIVIDTGPQITMNTNIALNAANIVLIPTDLSQASFDGIEAIYDVLDMLEEDAGLKLERRLIVMTATHKEGAISNVKARKEFKSRFGKDFFTDFSIPHRISVNNAQWNYDKPVSAKSTEQKGDKLYDSYAKLTKELLS